jgi:hypothetical protein
MGGWDTAITQSTIIHPSTVRKALAVMSDIIAKFNQHLMANDIPEVRLGYPTGSSAYHLIDSEDTVYGDIDLQLIVPELKILKGRTMSQIQRYWTTMLSEYLIADLRSAIHPESTTGHLIICIGNNAWVQVDLMVHPTSLATWGRYRVTPERGVKGLLNGNMFSVLGELLTMSIQHAGVQFKQRDGMKINFVKTRKDYEMVTLTTDIENFIRHIFDHEYQQITEQDPSTARVDALLTQHPGCNLKDVKISNLVNAVKGLAFSFEANCMYGRGDLIGYNDASMFLDRFWQIYEDKAIADITAKKRNKAQTPESRARAEEDKNKVLQGLEMVKNLFK